jgi:hypothetical protein
MFMRYQNSIQSVPKTPRCPSCAQIMRPAGISSRFGNLPYPYTFECRGCGVSHIEPTPFAVKLGGIEGNQSSKKPSLRALVGKLDALEGAQILRACRKRLWVH